MKHMLDFKQIAEISFIVGELNQTVVFSKGLIITKDNLAQFLQNTYDA